jgi:succinate dehydrogenase/fumarate reductase flavoprotein subunit
MIVPCADVDHWSRSADVVVVGCGIAGVCAAIAAREAGAAVLVLERSGGCSGSTAVAAGHFYLGGGTAVQAACGFHDDAEALSAYLTAVSSAPDEEKIAAFARGSAGHFDWLEARGVPFDRSYYAFKAVIQPGRECLIWTGNERVWPFRDRARAAPRGHKVAFDGVEGGGALALNRLAEHAKAIGVETMFDSKVDALVGADDRIVGVRARRFGEERFYRASRGVVLAAGGFTQNAEMMARHVPRFVDTHLMSGPYDDGTAIRLGVAAGGATQHMDGFLLTSPIYPPEQLVKGILVNREGRRFVAEDSYHTRTSIEIADQPGGVAYLILDADIFAYPEWSKQANQRLIDGFATIREMEQALELPSNSLQQLLADYNIDAAAGNDPDFGKAPEWLKPLDAAPWAAFDFSFGRALFNGFTLGGLRISAQGEVLNEAGTQIPGLYAAGACASMLAHDARDYASGISLSAGSFFGRQAGHHAGLSMEYAS